MPETSTPRDSPEKVLQALTPILAMSETSTPLDSPEKVLQALVTQIRKGTEGKPLSAYVYGSSIVLNMILEVATGASSLPTFNLQGFQLNQIRKDVKTIEKNVRILNNGLTKASFDFFARQNYKKALESAIEGFRIAADLETKVIASTMKILAEIMLEYGTTSESLGKILKRSLDELLDDAMVAECWTTARKQDQVKVVPDMVTKRMEYRKNMDKMNNLLSNIYPMMSQYLGWTLPDRDLSVDSDCLGIIDTKYIPEGEEDQVRICIGKLNGESVRVHIHKQIDNMLKCTVYPSADTVPSSSQPTISYPIKSRPERAEKLKIVIRKSEKTNEFELETLHDEQPDLGLFSEQTEAEADRVAAEKEEADTVAVEKTEADRVAEHVRQIETENKKLKMEIEKIETSQKVQEEASRIQLEAAKSMIELEKNMREEREQHAKDLKRHINEKQMVDEQIERANKDKSLLLREKMEQVKKVHETERRAEKEKEESKREIEKIEASKKVQEEALRIQLEAAKSKIELADQRTIELEKNTREEREQHEQDLKRYLNEKQMVDEQIERANKDKSVLLREKMVQEEKVHETERRAEKEKEESKRVIEQIKASQKDQEETSRKQLEAAKAGIELANQRTIELEKNTRTEREQHEKDMKMADERHLNEKQMVAKQIERDKKIEIENIEALQKVQEETSRMQLEAAKGEIELANEQIERAKKIENCFKGNLTKFEDIKDILEHINETNFPNGTMSLYSAALFDGVIRNFRRNKFYQNTEHLKTLRSFKMQGWCPWEQEFVRMNHQQWVIAQLISQTPLIPDSCFTARGSSQYGGVQKWGPQMAVNGKVSYSDQEFFHTTGGDGTLFPWLEVELPAPVLVSSITVVNRQNKCGDKFRDVEVRAGMEDIPLNWGNRQKILEVNKPLGFYKGPAKWSKAGEHLIVLDTPTLAKYITICIVNGPGVLQVNGIKINEGDILDSNLLVV